jgi:hypothetical protein
MQRAGKAESRGGSEKGGRQQGIQRAGEADNRLPRAFERRLGHHLLEADADDGGLGVAAHAEARRRQVAHPEAGHAAVHGTGLPK